MGRNLFEETQSDDEDINKIEINKEFARRFEHNKKREDLQRLEELKKKGLVEDSEETSSETDDENDDLLDSGKSDLQFYDALVKISTKDPIITQKDIKLFYSDDDDENKAEEHGKKRRMGKDKPMYLKDLIAKQLMEEGPEFEKASEPKVKSHADELEEDRIAFLAAVEKEFNESEGDLLMEKKGKREIEEEGDDAEIRKRLDEFFGDDGILSDNEMFLKNFLSNKMWIHKDRNQKPSPEELYGISDDEEELEKQDKYESQFNFRYEEGAGDRVQGHARFTEDSIRKKENARKAQRKSKEARMAQAEFERKEELKHLKNVKKKEIMEKLEKIRAIAGIGMDGVCALNEGDLEEDFDPDEYDRKMKETFDADYYNAEDADPGFQSDGGDGNVEKPDFDKEDELLGIPKGWDVCGSGGGFFAAREKILERDGENKDSELSSDKNQEEEEEEEEPQEVGKRKRKRIMSLQEKVAIDKELEEYYKLDYEDTIGDLKTRFKYTSVPANRYGLTPPELLMLDEKELNQFISMKKLAPYRQKEWKIPNGKRYELKKKTKVLLHGGKLNDQKFVKKRTLKHDGHVTSLVPASINQSKEQEGATGELGTSKRSRKRRRHAELKLSQSRLMAYGKIPPKSKTPKNH